MFGQNDNLSEQTFGWPAILTGHVQHKCYRQLSEIILSPATPQYEKIVVALEPRHIRTFTENFCDKADWITLFKALNATIKKIKHSWV